jgi:hypothetical protein
MTVRSLQIHRPIDRELQTQQQLTPEIKLRYTHNTVCAWECISRCVVVEKDPCMVVDQADDRAWYFTAKLVATFPVQ